MLWRTLEGWRQGSVRMSEKSEGWSRYQNNVGADSPKSGMETEDHVPRAEHMDPINVVHHQGRSTQDSAPPLKGTHPYYCFEGDPTDEQGIPWGEECSEGAGRPSPFLRHGLAGVSLQGVTRLNFCKKGVKLVPECIKRTCYKLWSLLTWPSSMARNGSSSTTQLLLTRPRQLRRGCRGTLWPSPAPRPGPRGVQTSNPLDYKLWAVLKDMAFWNRHNSLENLRRSTVKTAAEILLKMVRAAIAEWPEHLKACVKAEGSNFVWHYYKWKLKTTANKLFCSKSGYFV